VNTQDKSNSDWTNPGKRCSHLLICFVLFCFYFFPNNTFAKEVSPILITVTDGDTKERLIGVSVYTNDNKFVAQTDMEGNVSIPLLSHREELNFSYVGYKTLKVPYFELRRQRNVKMYSENVIEGIVVIGRTDAAPEELPFVIDRISAEQIASRNSQSTADVLGEHASVYIQKSQLGGGSPILRGFEANKVLLVLDGIRLNNAIYRNGHLQNAITTDASIMDQVEVIYGPGSLMYGSEALGGVVHFRTREPRVSFSHSDQIADARAFTRFSSANLEKTAHFDFEYGAAQWASLTSFTYSDFGDLKSGSKRPEAYPNFGRRTHVITTSNGVDEIHEIGDPSIQKGADYRQIDFLQKVKFQPKESLYFVGNFQYSTSSNLPRYDDLLDTLESADKLKWAESYYGPQTRLMASLKMKAFAPKWLYSKATAIAAFQFLEEDRLNRRFKRDRRTFNLEDVFVYSFTLDFDKAFGKNTISYGLDGNYNRVISEAGDLDIETRKIRREVFTRFPSDYSTMLSSAGYLNYRWKGLDSMLVFNVGARYTLTNLFAKYKASDLERISWPEEYVTSGVTSSNDAITYGAGLTLNTRDKWQVHLLASTAFRSPNIDDFAKLRVQGGQVLLPNTNLNPEHASTAEATLGKTIGSDKTFCKLSATGFYTLLEDVIVRQAGIGPSGETKLWIPSAEDSFDIQQNFNAENGFIYGGSGNVLFKLNNNWEFSSGLNYTFGRVNFKNEVIDTLVPMAHIPPVYGQTRLAYSAKKFKFEVVARYNAKKSIEEYAVNNITKNEETNAMEIDRGGTSDNPELGIAYTVGNEVIFEGVYGWTTFNLYGSYAFNEKFSIDLAVENITDQHYRHFSSAISAPGRNFILALRGKF
jgi:hemoglobin/transferrin/lactoferrin receptor protein